MSLRPYVSIPGWVLLALLSGLTTAGAVPPADVAVPSARAASGPHAASRFSLGAPSPAQGARVRLREVMQIEVPVRAAKAILLRVNGRDVSPRVDYDGRTVRYAARLETGVHTVELMARDASAQDHRLQWRFTVEATPWWSWLMGEDEDDELLEEWSWWGTR